MRHSVCHVVAIHEPTGRVLASQTPAGWLLPTFTAHVAVGQPRLFARAAAVSPFETTPRCLASARLDPAAASSDVAIVVDIETAPGATDPRVLSHAHLLSGRAVLDYQAEVVQLVVQHPASIAFLQRHWMDGVATWVAAAVGDDARAIRRSGEIYRAEPHRAVVAFDVGGERLHFKGDARQSFIEPLVTRFIAERSEAAVAPTRAFDARRGWWLTGHVDGAPLGAEAWPAHLTACDAWRGLQRALQPSHAALEALGVPRITPARVRAAVARALSEAPRSTASPTESEVSTRCEAVLASPVAGLPELVVHTDAAPRNLLWDGRRVAFLDLDALRLGFGAIAGELIARRMRHVLAPPQRARLADHAFRSLLGDLGQSHLWRHRAGVPALADLFLLTDRLERLASPDFAGEREASLRHLRQQLAADFLSRVSRWFVHDSHMCDS